MPRTNGDGDVAVIGMSCRVAGADNPSELWDLLASSRDVLSEITRFNMKGYYHPEGGPRKGLTNVKSAYMMEDEKIPLFDHAFFHTTPVEAIAMDPQQRMLLEVAYETIENAGIPLEDFVGTDTAVYAGIDSCDYHSVLSRDIDDTPKYLATGTATCMAANRVSYFFDLSGPSLAVDTACSSTMAALHQAVGTLQNNDSAMSLVCGAKLILTPDMFMPSSELGFLSPSGRCRSFDAAGDGYGRGEGVLALLLKPLKKALEDRDPIRAVIKGTRLNQDGRTQGITLPSSKAQKHNMESLYTELGLSPNDIQYVEAHGTGTAAGDPLEFCAINGVFEQSGRDEPLVVGSIKSNIGHLEACAALASIIKTIQCLERGMIPAQMHFINPNPKIKFRDVKVPTEMMDWPRTRGAIRRAAVNTFGAGGTNGHAILESSPRASSQAVVLERPLLYKVSAADEHSLRRLSLRYADYIELKQPNLHDFAYTLLSRRSNLRYSRVFTASTHKEAIQKLRAELPQVYSKGNEPVKEIAFLFTGQGAQWAEMGKTLIDQSPIFKAVMLECEHIMASLPDKPSWSIIEELSKAASVSKIYQSELSQPLCTALQLGLVTLWTSWGLVPNAVVGHSSGEIAAAYTAGIISLRDAVIVAFYRGLFTSVLSTAAAKGSMCAVGLNEDDASALLEGFADRVQLAAVNSPTSCTLSGDHDAIMELMNVCTQKGIFCRELRIDMAYHSFHMLPVASSYEEALTNAKVLPFETAATCDMFSSVSGQRIGQQECIPFYWKQNMVSTVQFSSALTECMYHHPEISVILEIGPHPALKGPAQETLRSLGRNSVDYFHSCLRGKNDMETLLASAGAMIARGVPLKTPNINAREVVVTGLRFAHELGNTLTNVPGYQWDHSTSFWTESRISSNLRQRRFPRHQLLGSRYVEDLPLCPSWRSLIMLKEVPWLMELKTGGATLMPPAAFILMSLEAARQLHNAGNLNASSTLLSDMQFDSPLQLASFNNADTVVELHLKASQTDRANVYHFDIFSLTRDRPSDSIRHCSGNFEWTSILVEKSNLTDSSEGHDPLLLGKSQEFAQDLSLKMKELRIDSRGSRGVFETTSKYYENYCIDPMALNSILRLPPVSLLGRGLPATHRVTSIGSVAIPIGVQTLHTGKFAIEVRASHPYGGQSNIEICLDEARMSISDVRFEVDQLLNQKPLLKSLYYKPAMLPDISRLSASGPISLSECLDIVTHKWPMSDIAVAGLASEDVNTILSALEGVRLEERPRFRSIQILGEAVGPTSERIRFVEDFGVDAKFHILFTSENFGAEQSCRRLLSNGLACVRAIDQIEEAMRSESFTQICNITGFNQDDWTLWRVDDRSTGSVSNSKATIFTCPYQGISSIDCLPGAECVSLQAGAVRKFCQRSDQGRYDTVIIDSVEKSVITTWSGQDLVPWLQTLLRYSQSILWVTQQAAQSPYSNVAGTLLRTLQSEQPSLKVMWLVFRDTEPLPFIQATIKSAYAALLKGENEVKLEVKDSQVYILRYLPDDQLSATVGLTPPITMPGSIVDKDYELSLSAPRAPVILSCNPDKFHVLKQGKVGVAVEASVIDIDDVEAFDGVNKRSVQPCIGKFFAGRVVSGTDRTFPSGSHVVGWHPGAHRNRLEVSPTHLQLCNEGVSSAVAVAEFAVLTTALCIVDGVARARIGDTFGIQFSGILREAIIRLCKKSEATVLESQAATSADFIVRLSRLDGLLVNGAPIDVDKYLESHHGVNKVTQAWKKREGLTSPLKLFEISDYQQAFRIPQVKTYSTVLVHSNIDKVKSSVAVYKKSESLFSSDGAYIIIGGLGGLGRYVCSWMVANGAKRFVTISRRGLNSEGAQQAFTAINATDASMEVIKADACDRKAIAVAFSQVRQTSPIKGIINMAMLLGDAPMVSITGEQWDRALRLKIDSSWILHEETLGDSLEFFIMFSSIASVLGNRNQGGYNVGNTFLNALASYRRSLGLTAVSIALGAMTDIGVLHDLGREDLLQTLSRSGVSPLRKEDLAKIMEAAVLESHRSERSLIVTGLEMFERVDGKLVGSQDQSQTYWIDVPEFGFLQDHKISSAPGKSDLSLSLREQLRKLEGMDDARDMLLDAFLAFASQMLGFDPSTFHPFSPLAMYGLDSLSAVSCQYWFFRELSVDVSVADVLNAASITHLIEQAYARLSSSI